MAKVTDQLLAAAAAAGRGDKNGALAIAARLRNRHIETAADLLCGELFTEIQAEIKARFDSLDDLLRGIAAVGELTPRTSRQSGELWRADFVADGGGGVRAARDERRACGCAELHRY